MIEFRMPSLGADMEAGILNEWLIKPGDSVQRGDIIAVVETQKGLIEIEVFDEGIVERLLVQEDEKIPVGTVMAILVGDKEQKVAPVPAHAASPQPEKATDKKLPAEIPVSPRSVRATPLARHMAEEQGIDLTTLTGSGEGGAITKEDVEKAIVEKVAPEPKVQSAAADSIRMAVAAAMSRSNREIPHYYLSAKVDMRRALNWLTEANKQRSVKQRLLLVVLLIKAVAKALAEVPDLNAYWENGLQKKDDINIGFAVSLRKGGVMIPALHHVDRKSLDELMTLLNDVIPRARSLKLRSSELSDSTITMTSLGEGNAEQVFGVIYPPQVAVVGFGSVAEIPWAENGMLDVRPALTVTLAADHRATDGIIGSRFLMSIKDHLQNPELL